MQASASSISPPLIAASNPALRRVTQYAAVDDGRSLIVTSRAGPAIDLGLVVNLSTANSPFAWLLPFMPPEPKMRFRG